MAINFPNAPTLNQVYTTGSLSWLWDGTSWISNSSTSSYVLDGSGTANNVNLELIGGGVTDSINIQGSGGTTVAWDEGNQRITINSAASSNTTYTVSSTTATGGANLRLTGSDAVTDDVKFASGSNVTVTSTDANTITIAATNTTYSISAETVTGGANLRLTGSDLITDDVKFAGGTGVTVTRTDANTITITASDTLVSIANETASASTFYPGFFAASTGAQTGYVSSSKLTFIPSTGTLSATEVNSLSDVRFKDNIVDLTNSFSVLDQVRPVKFTWKDSGKTAYGVVAQDIEQVLPEVVSTNELGIKSVNYSQLVPFLIDVVKQQQREIDELKKRLI